MLTNYYNKRKFFSKYLRNVDFIQKYIFPGGMLPTKTILAKLLKVMDFNIS